MEITCNRCHQAVPADSCYCPACGLPQLVYSAEGEGAVPPASERWPEPVRDASSIDWKPGMRAALALAVPAGLLSSGISPLSALGIFWMAGGAAAAVTLYLRSQRPAWITLGAGARIGLVTGLIGAWIAFGVSGIWLFVQRVILHQSGQIDSVYKAFLDAFEQKAHESMSGMSATDAAQLQATFAQFRHGSRRLKVTPRSGRFPSRSTAPSWCCLLSLEARLAHVCWRGDAARSLELISTCAGEMRTACTFGDGFTGPLVPLLHNLLRNRPAFYHPARDTARESL